MTDKNQDACLSAFNSIISILSDFNNEDKKHVLGSVINWLKISDIGSGLGNAKESPLQSSPSRAIANISLESDVSPKDFLLEKLPGSNVERVACLAYYLTHYRDTPHFKTTDINKLNTEAAQPKFSNPAVAVNDSSKARLLVASGKGNKQLSAMGEQFVLALPNRDQAKSILNKMRPKRKAKKRAKRQ